MENHHHILLVIFVASSLLFGISNVDASEENGSDDVKNAFGSFLDEAKEALGPTSTWDLDKVKDALSPSVEEAKEALGPISSYDEVKEALTPLSSSIIDEAKDGVSPSTKSKASEHIDSVTSWLSQNELGPAPFYSSNKDEEGEEEASAQTPNEEDDKQNKEEISFEEAQKELGPISSFDLDNNEDEDASTPVSSPVNEADDNSDKDEDGSSPISSPSTSNEKHGSVRSLLSQSKEEIALEEANGGPIFSTDDPYEDEGASTPVSSLDEPEEAPSSSDEALDVDNENLGPMLSEDKEEIFADSPSILEEAQKELGPIASSDLDKDEDASSSVSSPVSPSTLIETKEALGKLTSNPFDLTKGKFGKIRSLLSDKKEKKYSDSPTDSDKAPEGPASSGDDDLDKDKDASSPIPSVEEPEEAFASDSPSSSDEALDVDSENLGPMLSEDKEEIFADSPSILEEAQKELGPISSSDLDKEEDASSSVSSPVSPSPLIETKEALGTLSSNPFDLTKGKFGKIRSLLSKNKEKKSSDSPTDSDKKPSPVPSDDDDLDKNGDKAEEEAVEPQGSTDSSSDLEEAQKELGPIPSFDLDKDEDASTPEAFDPDSPSKSPTYLDHDVALALESLIKQAQSNSQLLLEEADKLLSDANFTPSKSGGCVQKCKDNYASCLDSLDKAMEDLKSRNAELLANDVNAVEGDICTCRKCFKGTLENESPLNDLEEATLKATRECINVLDHC